MYWFLVDNNENKKTKAVNKNAVATIGHNEYKDVLSKNECLRHSMNRIQIKDHRIGIMKSTKFHCLVLITKYMSKIMDTEY